MPIYKYNQVYEIGLKEEKGKMAKYSSTVHYNITTSLDASGITKLQAELNRLAHEITDLNKRDLMTNTQTQAAISDIKRIENALNKAFNPKLGMLNTRTLMSELTAGGRSLNQIYQNLGTRGTSAMAQLYGQLGKIDTGMKSVSKATDKVFNTLGNTVRWGVIASGFQYVLNSAHSAVQYMSDLDKSLTNIRLVTDESKESMREFARYANEAAQNLGSTTVKYTDAALIFAQQGYGLSDQKILADYTIKTANATGQDTAEVSEQMTSLINGFQLSVEDVGGALDVMAKIANVSAADLEELATATSKVASTANTLGVTQEQLTAQIATIVSVTREAPENVGNALKTIYARFGDLSLGETLEDGTDLGKVSATLNKIGVQVLDDTGAMRDMGAIMEDLMAVWDTLDTGNKQAAAVTLAGKYQYNRLMALMENSDMYESYYKDALNSEGTLDTMQSEYMESLQGKTNTLIASLQGALSALIDQDSFGPFIEGLTDIVNLFTQLVDAIGGGSAALTAFGAIAMNVFSNNIGRSISNMISNRETNRVAQANIQANADMAKSNMLSAGVSHNSNLMKTFASDIEGVNKYAGNMNQEQIDQVNQKTKTYAQAVIKADEATKKYEQGIIGAKAALEVFGVAEDGAGQSTIALIQKLEAGDAGLEDLDVSLSNLIDDFINTQTRTVSLANALEKLDTDLDNVNWHKIISQSNQLQENFNKLLPTLKKIGMSDKNIDQLKVSLIELGKITDGETIDFEKFSATLAKAGSSLDDFRISVMLAADAGKIEAQQLEQLRQEMISSAAAANTLSAEHQGLAASMHTQSMASHISNLASSAMSLVFAVQSFQALGSIWANEDLTLGEKVGQTLMNGTMAVAMLTMAYNEYAMAKAAITAETGANTLAEGLQIKIRESLIRQTTNLTAAEMALAAARRSGDAAAVASAEKTIAAIRESTAKMTTLQLAGTTFGNVLSKGLTAAGNALKVLGGPIGWITLLLGGATAAWGVYQKQVEQAKKAQEESVAKAQEDIKTRQKLADDFTKLYESYQKGEASSEELKAVANELNQILGEQTLEIAAAAGEWANYNNQLKGAIETANEADLGTLIAAKETNKEAFEKDWTHEAIGGGFFKSFATTAASQSTLYKIEDETSSISRNYRGEYNWDINSSPEQRVKDYAKATGLLTDKLAELDLMFSQGKISQKTYADSMREVNNELVNLKRLETEEFNAYKNSLESPAIMKASEIGTQLGDNANYQEIIDAYFSDSQTKEYLESLEGWSEQLQWIISQTTNETQKIALMMQQSKESFGANAKDKVVSSIEANGIDTASLGISDTNQYADAMVSDMLAQIESSGLTSEEQIKFIAGIDWSKSLGEIQSDINNINVSGQLPKLAFEPTLTDRSDFTEEEINQLLEDTNMSESGFQRMSADIFASSEIGSQAASIEQEIQYLESLGDISEETTKKIAELRQEYENLGDTSEDIAAYNLQMNKGIAKLIDKWEDLSSVLSDDAAKGTSDYYQALGELDEIMSDILNIDIGVLSNGFYQNEEAIAAMTAAAEGDAEAVDTLRQLASEDIIMNLDVQNISAEDKDYLINNELLPMLADFQAQLDGMPLGASVDVNTDPFIQKLNELAHLGQLSRDQLTNILSSVGMEGNIEMVEEPHSEEVTQYFPKYKLDTSGDVPQIVPDGVEPITYKQEGTFSYPTIKGATYTGSGIQTVGSSSGKPSGGGGGGGGGGGSSYKPKTEKPVDEDIDRYQDVHAHLDRIANDFEKVADEQERLTGKSLIRNMEKQLDLLEKQAEQQQRKIDIQKQEKNELADELATFGISIDSDGFMTNFAEISQKFEDEYNALVGQYNAATTEEAQESIKEQMDAKKEEWDKFKEAASRWDELVQNEMPELEKALQDTRNQMEDIRIEAFNMAVEAADNIKEVRDAWADYMGFMSGLNPDSPFRALIEDAQKYENALGSVQAKQEDLDKLMQWLPQYKEGGVITADNPFGENSAAFYEALQTAYESYIEAALEAEQLYYDQIDDIIESYDDIADRIEKRMENYSRLTEQLDHYASVIETLYGEEDYDNLLALKRANQDVLESSIEQSRKNLSMWQGELAKYNKETQPEIWEAIHEKVVEAESELNGLIEEAAQNTAEILEMAIDKTVKEWKDTMLGGDSDWMETQWELSKELAGQYLDTVESTYEIEKLRAKYNSLANDTASLRIREQINEQMETELAYLLEKDKLSQFDVDYANAKLEILQKQIALEDARANKNQMKLRRDSQGNYSYVYAADQDNIAQAESDLMDAEFNAYSMSKDNYMENYDSYISAISNAAEQIKAIYADTTLTIEEKAERAQEIYDWLSEYLTGVAEQIGVSEQGMLESVARLAQDTSGITGETFGEIAKAMEEDWIGALENIGVANNENFDHIIHNIDAFLDATKTKWEELEDHTDEWAKNVQDIADEGTDGFRNVDDVIININKDMKDLNEETEHFFSLINDDLGTIDSAVGKLADYEQQILGLKESTSKIRAELEATKAELEEKNQEIRRLSGLEGGGNDDNGSGGGSGNNGSGDGGSGGTGYAGTKYSREELLDGLAGNIWYYGDWANDPTRSTSLTKKFNATVAKEAQDYVNKGMSALKKGWSERSYYEQFSPDKFDTGGYTGSWGTYGKFAMLHQKELVLNSSDTENILSAVNMVRELVSALKTESLLSNYNTLRNKNIAMNTGNNIEQNISIYADFPAAESAAEIKAALEGLAQKAVQYSYKNR